MSAFATSLLVWGFLAALLLVVELLALSDAVPWNTLTWTLRQLIVRSPLVYPAIAGLLLVFAVHIRMQRAKKNEPEGRS